MSYNSISRKNLTLLGLVLLVAVISGFFINYYTSDQSQSLNEKKEVMQGSSSSWFVSSEEGQITDVSRNSSQLLYLADNGIDSGGVGGGGHMSGKDLVVKDVKTGEEKVIAKDVGDAKFSPDASEVVIVNSYKEVKILNIEDGKELVKIGKHGSSPIFSSDGKFIIYHKLADEGEGQGLYEQSPYGLVQYDIERQTERILTENKDDYEPVGFSLDMSKLFFNSARAYEPVVNGYENHVVSLWVIDMNTKEVTRLTNISEEAERRGELIPLVSQNALWTSDRMVIISETDGEVWKFVLDSDGMLDSARKIALGYSPNWALVDESINLMTKSDDDSSWKVFNIK